MTASSACPTGKRMYPSERAADIGLEDCRREGREESSSYLCDLCGSYHLSHYAPGYFIEHEWEEQ